jgi:O-antigen/teichoic acid export membrane protein
MIPAFLDSVSLNFPVYIVAASFPAFVAGSFNFSRQIIGLPLLMISATVAQVFYQNLNEKKQHTLKLMPEIVGLSKVMLAVALGYILFFIFFGEKFFLFVFGNSWGDAGTYSSILCISFGVKFVISPLLMGFPVVNKLKRDSIWKVLYFFSMCLLFVLRQSDIENFLIIFSCVEAVVYLIGLFMLLDAVARFDKLSS